MDATTIGRWRGLAVIAIAGLVMACAGGPAQPTEDGTDVLMYKGGPGRTGESVGGIAGEGRVLWTVATGGPMDSSPAILDGVAYIVGGEGRLLALDVATGSQRWASKADGLVGSPAIAGERIIALGQDGSINAIRLDGSSDWRTAADLAPKSTPLVLGDLLVAGGRGGGIQAFDAASGAARWQVQTGDELPRAAAGDETQAYIGSHDGRLYAIEAATGETAWAVETTADHFATPAVRDGRVLAAAGNSDQSTLLAIDAASGAERWRFVPPDGRGLHSPSVEDGAVYISTDRNLYALAPDGGTILWTREGEPWNTAGIAIADATLYAIAAGGTLYALDAATGSERWRLYLGGDVQTGTTLADGRLIVGTEGGSVMAIGAGEG